MHEGGFAVAAGVDGERTFERPDGTLIPVAPALPEWHGTNDHALVPTIARLAMAGVAIDTQTTTPRSDGEPFDLGWALDVLYVPAGTPATH